MAEMIGLLPLFNSQDFAFGELRLEFQLDA